MAMREDTIAARVKELTDARDRLSRRTIISCTAAALPAAAVASLPALAVTADAELLALGERLRVAWAAERASYDRGAPDEETDALADACAEIVQSIIAVRATTVAGLAVKAQAAIWCCGGEPFADGEGDCLDRRAVQSMIEDIQAMQAAA